MIKLDFRISENSQASVKSFSDPKAIYEEMKEYSKADREIFFLIFLNPRNQILKIEPNSIGSVDGSSVYPKEIFRSALLANASSIICVHNHPSGDPTASQADKELTKQLVGCGLMLDIKILDHVILGSDGKFFSFADDGLIDDYEIMAIRR